jgi:hypothetical protein
MRFLRSVLVVTRQNRLANEAIRRTLKVDSLNDTFSAYRNNWFNHVTQMDYSDFPQYMLLYKPTEKRGQDHPMKRWTSQM